MGQFIKLSNTIFDPDNSRPLSDYGYLPAVDSAGIYKLKTADLLNDGGAGAAALSFGGTATGDDLPVWADGILTAPDQMSGSINYNSGVSITDPKKLTVAAIIKSTTGLFNVFQGLGTGNAYVRVNGQGIQSNVTGGDILGIPTGQWFCFVVTLSVDGLKAVGPRGDIKPFAYGTPPTGPNNPMLIGSTATTTYSWRGDYAFFGIWDRTFSDDEMYGLRNGMKVFAKSKGIKIS